MLKKHNFIPPQQCESKKILSNIGLDGAKWQYDTKCAETVKIRENGISQLNEDIERW